jgi:hypothetical protein
MVIMGLPMTASEGGVEVKMTASVWYWVAERKWILSVTPSGHHEIDLGGRNGFTTPDEALGYLRHWADQRGLAVTAMGPWEGQGVSLFDLVRVDV